MGLSETLFAIVPMVLFGTCAHVLLGRLTVSASPGPVRHRAVILGALGGVCGALSSGPYGRIGDFLG
jgi:hypothetical protein